MGTVFKQTTTKSVPAGAERVTVKGRACARWEGRGRTVTAPLSADGTRIVIESAKWYGTVNGKRVPLCRDKQAAERMLKKLEADAQLAAVGLADPFATGKRTSLADHLAEYDSHLRAKNDTDAHVRQTIARVRAVFDGCGFGVAGDVDAGRVGEWLTAKRGTTSGAEVPVGDSFTPAEVAGLLGVSGQAVRATVARHGLAASGHGKARRYPVATVVRLLALGGRGAGLETVNHYVRAVRGFMRWMVRSKRVGSNPLDTLTLVNAQVDVRRHRRELTEGEVRSLLATTRGSTRPFRGLTGPDRAALYLTAAATGFRATALASLTPTDFVLTNAVPTVTLAARFNKTKKPKVQPLPADVAAELARFLAGKPAGVSVWGGTWATGKRAAEMLRGDLSAAGIPYVVESADGPLYADFHALRHTFLTLGGRAGIDLRTLQELAGHSKPELTARYSHRRLNDLAGAVQKLPNLLAEPDPIVCPQFGDPPFPSVHSGALPDTCPAAGGIGPETKKPLTAQGFPTVSSGILQRGRRDSNPQPPDRQYDPVALTKSWNFRHFRRKSLTAPAVASVGDVAPQVGGIVP
jgi:integrase